MLTEEKAGELSRELIRALRGARTQIALSRALGYQSNVVFAWESGRDEPSLEKFFVLLRRVGHAPEQWFEKFGRGAPEPDLSEPSSLPTYLKSLMAHRGIGEFASLLGVSRYAVSRWLSGKTRITLSEFLRFVDAATLSVLDLVALVVSPEELPSVENEWRRLEAARRSARQNPWSHAIVHMVELPSYQRLLVHSPGWFASRLGISLREEEESLRLLVELGRLVLEGGRYRGTVELAVDTRPDPDATRKLAAFWMQQAVERVLIPGSGRFAFNTFGIARTDLEKLRELQRRYFAELRSIISESPQTEAVAVATFGLFTLAAEPEEASGRPRAVRGKH